MAIDSSELQMYDKPFYGIDGVDDDLQFERMEDFSGGEEDYRRSTLIDPNQCQKLVNIIVRDNYEAWTRPGADPFTAQFSANPIRSLAYFDTPTNKFILAICNGVMKACAGSNQDWQDIAYTPSATNLLPEIAQGVDTILISDGSGAMAILDANLNLTTCTTDSNVDPPVGANILCYMTGRMFAAGFSGGVTGKEREAIWVSNRLAFGNGEWNGTTRSFRVGIGDGDPVMALCPMQGSMLGVFKANSVWIVNCDPTAEPVNFQASTVVDSVGFGVGCVGKRAFAALANDVFFMAQDGVRSVQRMQAAAAQWQLSAPISQPVQQYINRINPAFRQNIVASSYKEFVLFSVPLDSSAVNNAVLVYNSRLGRWLGCWTGWEPAQFVTTRFNSEQQLLFSDANGYVNFWKDTADTNNPATYLDNGQNIPCSVWTRSLQFGQSNNSKSAYNCVIHFTAGSSSPVLTAVLDLADSRRFSEGFANTGDILGQARLPFTLASVKPLKVTQSLRSLPKFQEMFLKIETTSGWFKLRNLSVTAFVNAMDG